MYQSHANESHVSSILNKGLPNNNEPNSPAHVQQEITEGGKNSYPLCFHHSCHPLVYRLVISDWVHIYNFIIIVYLHARLLY